MSTKSSTKKSIKGTQTEKRLVLAYVSESGAYTRYTYYSQQATKEGYFPIARIFDETVENELRHSKIFFKYLEGGEVEIPVEVTAGVIGDTATNLALAAEGEQREGVDEYTESAKIAEEEGFTEIAEHFRKIGEIERHHEARFKLYLKEVKDGTVWKRDHEITWRCLVCGFEYKGTEPPKVCPACDHPYQHYMSTEPDHM